jgi:hypothetical protein
MRFEIFLRPTQLAGVGMGDVKVNFRRLPDVLRLDEARSPDRELETSI